MKIIKKVVITHVFAVVVAIVIIGILTSTNIINFNPTNTSPLTEILKQIQEEGNFIFGSEVRKGGTILVGPGCMLSENSSRDYIIIDDGSGRCIEREEEHDECLTNGDLWLTNSEKCIKLDKTNTTPEPEILFNFTFYMRNTTDDTLEVEYCEACIIKDFNADAVWVDDPCSMCYELKSVFGYDPEIDWDMIETFEEPENITAETNSCLSEDDCIACAVMGDG